MHFLMVLMLVLALPRAAGAQGTGGGWRGVEIQDSTKVEAHEPGWEPPRGGVKVMASGVWLGVEVRDLTKKDAEELGWQPARGVKVTAIVPRGPAALAGLVAGDVVEFLDGTEVDNKAAFDAAIARKTVGAETKFKTLRVGAIVQKMPEVGEAGLLLQLDTGGHMAKIQDIVFTPDGKFLVSASDDKVIRVWDLATGKTVRTIRGEAEPGHAGTIHAIALSPDGKFLAAAGFMATFNGTNYVEVGAIRLYDFASGARGAAEEAFECRSRPLLFARWPAADFG